MLSPQTGRRGVVQLPMVGPLWPRFSCLQLSGRAGLGYRCYGFQGDHVPSSVSCCSAQISLCAPKPLSVIDYVPELSHWLARPVAGTVFLLVASRVVALGFKNYLRLPRRVSTPDFESAATGRVWCLMRRSGSIL